MIPIQVTPDMQVDELLRQHPAAGQVFIHLHTGCVGCPFARFCTLADVAQNYGLDCGKLIRSLGQAAQAKPPG